MENGWSLSEMTTMRRVDEMRFVHLANSNHTRPSFDGDRTRKGFRMSSAGALDRAPDFSEEIGMAVTKGPCPNEGQGGDIPSTSA